MKQIVEKPIMTWFVVNMCNRWGDKKLLRTDKPQIVFYSINEAYEYASEMAKQHSRGDYAVFECIGRILSHPENPPGKPGLRKKKKVVCEPATLGGT